MVKKVAATKKEDKLVKALIENNLSLQKKTTELLHGFNELSKRIDKLVNLFETASKKVTEARIDDDKMAALAGKLESLLDQNKEIAKGLILLEKYVRGRSEFESGQGFKARSSENYNF